MRKGQNGMVVGVAFLAVVISVSAILIVSGVVPGLGQVSQDEKPIDQSNPVVSTCDSTTTPNLLCDYHTGEGICNVEYS